VGGEHFTNDVAVALRTPVNEAEKIKKKHGCALTSMVPEEDAIEVPSVGGRKPRIMARQVLGDVLQAARKRSARWPSPRSAARASTAA
jgi:cell division protein FtsA